MNRDELREELIAYLGGNSSLAEFLRWEAVLSLASDVPTDVRRDLDRLALIGEEVERGIRNESDFKAVAGDIVDIASTVVLSAIPRTDTSATSADSSSVTVRSGPLQVAFESR